MSIHEVGCIREIEFGDPSWKKMLNEIKQTYVYYQPEYLAAFNEDGDTPVMFVYENGTEREISVFLKRDIGKSKYIRGLIDEGKYYDLISPYGYGGYVGECCDTKRLALLHHDYCARKGYVCEVVKFHPLNKNIKSYHGIISSDFHNIVRDLDNDLDKIWMDFKPKVRKNVKRAEKNGLTVIRDISGEYLRDFLEIYYGTMERNNASENYYFSELFFRQIQEMGKFFIYFHVLFGDKIISSELVLYDSFCCYSFLGGTDNNYYMYRPNDLLKYEIIKWANEKGLSCFILGGGHGSDDGIFRYKESFAPNGVFDFYVGTDIFNYSTYNYLCEIRSYADAGFDISNKLCPAYRF